VEEGELGLHFPVSWYVPEFKGEGKDAVTIFHLLTHTSGLRNDDVEAYAKKVKGTIALPPLDATQHRVLAEELAHQYGAPLFQAPGKEMSYCNFGYRLLGEVIRRVSGKSLVEFAAERIFDPLGMKDTSYTLHGAMVARTVRRPIDDPNAWLDTGYIRENPWGGGGAFSVAMDMAVFGQMFLNRGSYGEARILSPVTVAAMTRNQLPGIGARYGAEVFPEASWGLGWSIVGEKKCDQYAGGSSPAAMFCHGGAGGPFLWIDPDHQMVTVCLSVTLDTIPNVRMGDCRGHFLGMVMASIVEE